MCDLDAFQVTAIFVVFEKFGLVLKLNFQAVIKSAASAASPIAWGEPGRQLRLAGDGFGALPKQSGRLR